MYFHLRRYTGIEKTHRDRIFLSKESQYIGIPVLSHSPTNQTLFRLSPVNQFRIAIPNIRGGTDTPIQINIFSQDTLFNTGTVIPVQQLHERPIKVNVVWCQGTSLYVWRNNKDSVDSLIFIKMNLI